MELDSVLLEVRATREAFARAHGYDLRAMVAELRALDERGDWPVVRLAPRRPAGWRAEAAPSSLPVAESDHAVV